ncbi:MAG: Holliday junction resolvase RecU, partial [Lachnospiraceae bacterium]|nr:Holliday junction resolvase RecU [Lachnospiraceae bacterium]
IHEHQMTFMEDFEKQDGISFFLIYFSHREIYYYMRFEEALKFWNRGRSGGRKSVRIEELDDEFFFSSSNGYFLPYLDMINKDLGKRG